MLDKTNPSWNDYPTPDDLPEPVINDPALPLVSVVTPSFNQGRFIGETIESVLTQDYPNIEYWVIDGGSTDETLDVLRRYEDDPRFHWISEPDRGQSDAINKGFARCRGEIVAWLNSDDVYLPGAIRESVQPLVDHLEVALIYGDIEVIDPEGNLLGQITGTPFDMGRLVTDLHSIPQPTVFVRRRVVEQVGPLRCDFHHAMDLEWWIRIAAQGFRLQYFPNRRAQFRYHPTSKTVSAQVRFWEDREKLLETFFHSPAYASAYWQWRDVAFSNCYIYHGKALSDASERRSAIAKLWAGLWLAPWRLRSILVLLLIFDAYTGLKTWDLATGIKRQLQGDKSEPWVALLE